MIRLDHVSMRYPVPNRYRDYLTGRFRTRHVRALHEVCLSIAQGDCVGILGPNGAGKTTLLKLIGGLLYPWQGSVTVDGHDARRENRKAREKVGFVLNEERSFFWRLTGRQNLEFFGSLNDLSGRAARSRIGELLHLVGLDDASDTRVSDYSCGMRQRLSIARGLLADPEVLILDEPTKSLDPIGAEDLRRLIAQEVRSRGNKTLLIATHQSDEAETLCNRFCILKAGRIIEHSSMDRVSGHPGGLEAYYKARVREGDPGVC